MIICSNGTVSWHDDTPHGSDLSAIGYDVRYEGGQCNTTANISRATNLSVSWTMLGLEAGASYMVNIRTVNLFTHGNWSRLVMLQTPSRCELFFKLAHTQWYIKY